MRRIIQRILYHDFIFIEVLIVTKVMKMGCQIEFQKVLEVFAIFYNAMYYSIIYMPFKISPGIYSLNRLYHFYKTTIAVGTQILKLMYVRLYVPLHLKICKPLLLPQGQE